MKNSGKSPGATKMLQHEVWGISAKSWGQLDIGCSLSLKWIPSTCQKITQTVCLYPNFQILTCGTRRGTLAAFWPSSYKRNNFWKSKGESWHIRYKEDYSSREHSLTHSTSIFSIFYDHYWARKKVEKVKKPWREKQFVQRRRAATTAISIPLTFKLHFLHWYFLKI